MKIGLFIGRFQPFHLGHLSAIKQAFNKVNLLYIGIGSAIQSHQPGNPFTAAERMEMIENTLFDNKIALERFRIIPVPDINNYPAWPTHVRSLVPSFDIVFTGSGIVRSLFEKFDDVKIIDIEKELPISSTKVRETMLKGNNWKEYLSDATVKYIEKIDGVKRLQKIHTDL